MCLEKNRTNRLCKLCQRNYRGQNGASSNFLKHLKRAHPAEYVKIFNPKDGFALEKSESNNNTTAVDSAASTCRQNRIILSVTKNLIIRCNFPLNIMENTGFQDFMEDCYFKCEPILAKNVRRNNHLYYKLSFRLHRQLNPQQLSSRQLSLLCTY